MNKLILLTGLMAMTFNVLSQDRTISLWSNQIPFAIENNLKEQESISGGGSLVISDIVEPEILFYKCEGKEKRATVLICPGGGYAVEAYKHEGTRVAEWFNTLGMHAAVLKYRLPDKRISSEPTFTPITDAMQALNILHIKADELDIDHDAIGIMGFSAGGHLAASVSTLNHLERFEKQSNRKPAFSILMYPVISMTDALTHQGSKSNLLGARADAELVELFSLEKQVSRETPPTFILHASDDGAVKVDNTHAYARALERKGVPCKKVIFETGGHGFGFREGSETNKWINVLEQWLRNSKLIKE